MKNWDNKKSEELLKTILRLSNFDDAKNFFRDLLTEKEIAEFANRWEAAKMLSENEPYLKIQKKTGLSSRTVARVSKWLNSGMGGYKKMIETLHHGNSSFGKGLS